MSGVEFNIPQHQRLTGRASNTQMPNIPYGGSGICQRLYFSILRTFHFLSPTPVKMAGIRPLKFLLALFEEKIPRVNILLEPFKKKRDQQNWPSVCRVVLNRF